MTNMQAYMREMLQKGGILNSDASEIKNLAAELQKIDVKIKQILRHVDTMDAEEMRQKQAECWDMVRQSFKEHLRLTK